MILPVVGLLLLLGLFWYWASSLIGDDDNNPEATPSQAAIVVTQAAPTPSPTGEAAITPEETSQTDGQETTDGGNNNQTTEEETAPADEGDNGGGETDTGGTFAEGDVVTVNDDQVNLRSEATTDSDVVEVMDQGTELRITGPSEEANDLIWWPVEDEATGNVGWVAESLIEPAS